MYIYFQIETIKKEHPYSDALLIYYELLFVGKFLHFCIKNLLEFSFVVIQL
jgi:hypothetical protein